MRVELPLSLPLNLGESVVEGPGSLVWPSVGESIKGISHRHDASRKRDGVSGESRWIPLSIPALVMRGRDHPGRDQKIGPGAIKERRAHGRMLLHRVPLAAAEAARLEKETVRNGHFAQIVQGCG